MPIFEFKCNKCGTVFERLCLPGRGTNQERCPRCGSEESEKVLSTFAAISSGSGKGIEGGLSASSSCSSHGGFS